MPVDRLSLRSVNQYTHQPHYTMKTQVSSLILVVALLFGCSGERMAPEGMPAEGQAPLAYELGITTHNDNALVAQAIYNNVRVAYAIEATGELQFEVAVRLDDAPLRATMDLSKERIVTEGGNVVLTEPQKEALLNAGGKLSEYLLANKGTDVSMVEFTLLRMMEYWGKSPEGYAYAHNSYRAEAPRMNVRSRDEGITCIRKNQVVTAEYDDSRGSQAVSVTTGANYPQGYGCMGRCGADCGNVFIPSAWTKDCMDHDVCSYYNNSSGGSSDVNCGDEYDEAIDDWLWGVLSGCSG